MTTAKQAYDATLGTFLAAPAHLEPLAFDHPIRIAYAAGTQKWTGCDWRQPWSEGRIDAEGFQASQAAMLSRATSGQEAAMWRELAAWLLEVENDAREAEGAAASALALAESRNWPAAIRQAKRACELEFRYRDTSVWSPLLEALIDATVGTSGRGA